jgi:anaerobic magnesium-protoporphyrin IX monomethyl ester cyclase
VRILLINPPYLTTTSTLGVGHQIPLGLLMVGGPLADAGHEVRLLDAECRHLSRDAIVREAVEFAPDLVMTGHAGSTPAHPVCVAMLESIKAALPGATTVYGGVYPTFHAGDILRAVRAVDIVVRGEGEAATLALVTALASEPPCPLDTVAGIVFRRDGEVVSTPDRVPIADLDAYRIGWELIPDWGRYQCFGLGRSAVVQLSRGCVHSCRYCGQHEFWRSWRHRDPVSLVDQIERLYREHNVRFFPVADENAACNRAIWRQFLEELAARNLPVHLNVSLRSSDIVRDADLLPLYRRAGILYVAPGVESVRDEVLRQMGRTTVAADARLACRLLRQNGIYSVLFYQVDLDGCLTWRELRHALRELRRYDADWVNVMYLTPHRWTPIAADLAARASVEPNQLFWDYRHPVLAQQNLRPWQLFLAVKALEFLLHVTPRKAWHILRQPGWFSKRQMLWCLTHTTLVWTRELYDYTARALFTRWGASAHISSRQPTR